MCEDLRPEYWHLAMRGARQQPYRICFLLSPTRVNCGKRRSPWNGWGIGRRVRPLAEALYDANPDRRHAAARALGWIPKAGSRAAKALTRALSDRFQPQPVREEAAESLAYLGYLQAVPSLISVLDEPDVRMRFWAVFALGKIGHSQTFASRGAADTQVVKALEKMLSDEEVPPGNWWSVGREALAMLGHLDTNYQSELDSETERVRRDPQSSREDLRWAAGYSLTKFQNMRYF